MSFGKKFCALLLSTSFALALCGCEDTEYTPSEVVVSNNEEKEEEIKPFPALVCGVTLEKAVNKAVSLSPAMTEIICELGFQNRLVAVSSYCDYPEELGLMTVGSTENPDIDAIIELAPDAVFTLSLLSERDIYMLNHAGIAVLTPKIPESAEDYYTMYKEIAAAFYGKEVSDPDKGELKTVEVANKARLELQKAADAAPLESFVYVTEMLTLAGSDTFAGAILGLSGENLCRESGYVSADACEGQTPKYIIADDKLNREKITSNAVLNSMIYNGAKLVYISSSYLERPTARTAGVFEQIAEQCTVDSVQ
ncbi:MAG: ABC transporter substrate-binding protein [Oscillospiraceae bacterium]|nr:ABC transporter substrate-binding protein [Oscillospiraceae bacterium]